MQTDCADILLLITASRTRESPMAARIPSARRSTAQAAEAAPPAPVVPMDLHRELHRRTATGKRPGVNVIARNHPAYQALYQDFLAELEEEGLLTAKGEPQSRKKDAHQMAWAEFKGSAEGIAFAKQWAELVKKNSPEKARTSSSRALCVPQLIERAVAAYGHMTEDFAAEGGVAPKKWVNRYVVVNNSTGRITAPGVMKTGAVQIVPGVFYIPNGTPRSPCETHEQVIQEFRAEFAPEVDNNEE